MVTPEGRRGSASKIKTAIVALGKTVRGVARESGIPERTLVRKLSGDGMDLTLRELHAIAVALDVDVSALLPSESAAAGGAAA